MFVNEITLRASFAPVQSATISQSSTAELTRALTLDLKSGKNLVEIYGISASVDPESPRISGASGDVRVLDVVCTRKPHGAPDLHEDVASTEIKSLQATGRALEAERKLRQQELDLLDDSARLATQPSEPSSSSSDPTQVLDFLAKFAERKLGVQKALQSLEERIALHEKSVGMKLARYARKGDATAAIKATIVAKSDCKADLKLTYLVSGVSWQPFYDLHAITADGKPSANVSLRYCATIAQSTGEDWTDMTLTLSTASSQSLKRLSVPSIGPIKIRSAFSQGFGSAQQQQQQQQQHQTGGGLFGQPLFVQQTNAPAPAASTFGAATGGGAAFGAPSTTGRFGVGRGSATTENQPPPPPPAPSVFSSGFGAFGQQSAEASTTHAAPTAGLFGTAVGTAPPFPEPTASLSEQFQFVTQPDAAEEKEPESTAPSRSSLAIAYRVDGAVSLPSDGEQHKLTIATLDFTSELKYICVPRQSQAVFIVSRVKNTSEYELLAGPVNVFMDDSFVTKTALGFIAAGESFACVLGIDTALKVTYQQSSKTEHEPRRNFAEPHKTTTKTTRTTIANRQAFAIDALVVRDAIPLAAEETDQIAVMLRKPAGLAEAKDGQDVVVDLGEGAGKGKSTAKVRWTKVVDGKGGEKDGLYEWVCTIPAKEKITLEAQWDVKAPSKLRWDEVMPPRPFGFAPR